MYYVGYLPFRINDSVRDIHLLNIMMDASPLYTIPFHPIRQDMRRDYQGASKPSFTRTERPVSYYLIDFGLAIQYEMISGKIKFKFTLAKIAFESVPSSKFETPTSGYRVMSYGETKK